MKTPLTGLLAGTACLALGLAAVPAHAVPSNDCPGARPTAPVKPDNRPRPA